MTSTPIHVACATDQRYLPHVATLIESMVSANPAERITFHLFHDASVTADSHRRLREACLRHGLRLELVEPPLHLLRSLPPLLQNVTYPQVIWHRIWLAEMLPGLERVLYLDPDTLVVQDLWPLWCTNLRGCLLGAVRSGPPQVDGYSDATHRQLVAHGYFNSGVLLADLKRMREERLSERLIDVCAPLDYGLLYPDQDALNLAVAGSWHPLHPKWNVLATHYLHGDVSTHTRSDVALGEAVTSPAIMHFAGPIFFKPWHVRCVHPHRELYRAYRSRTPWPQTALDGAGDVKQRILSAVPIRMQLALARLILGLR